MVEATPIKTKTTTKTKKAIIALATILALETDSE
jgi:hypothetical protein